MINHLKAALLLFIVVLLLSACSASLKEEQTAAKDAVGEAFKKDPKATNNENEDIKFYLPFGFEVDKETPNNIILKNGSKKYILFYNPHEGPDSKVIYEAALKQKEYDFKETLSTKNGHHGYLLIKSTDKKLNELIIGTGGVKITTQSKTKNLSAEAGNMAEIIQSVEMK
ncbi:hypothetical protein RRV45_17235 [Bacillus sp. DTU_2020_1000418_1_SI_GHA_SEK_038]|uniref:hypothetical protein n=1 Tax=Bacillus sp. DTU_2020_1000418_1_SI_GHA_SEK_038 TaxID=3077585 RepID=UPI0028ECCCB3|nr:hypothetical protein [Bacillus sp. DTU_2020_1000418_1_SI_GHA_SEK_038]WNS74639.1 hypothetical protein RRV45_17235 [Bacillus sp. DTU_2020_1000418_1_SI_GHA_SEK_038]